MVSVIFQNSESTGQRLTLVTYIYWIHGFYWYSLCFFMLGKFHKEKKASHIVLCTMFCLYTECFLYFLILYTLRKQLRGCPPNWSPWKGREIIRGGGETSFYLLLSLLWGYFFFWSGFEKRWKWKQLMRAERTVVVQQTLRRLGMLAVHETKAPASGNCVLGSCCEGN